MAPASAMSDGNAAQATEPMTCQKGPEREPASGGGRNNGVILASGASQQAPDLDRIDEIVERLLALDVSEAAVEPIRDWVRDRRAGKPQTLAYFGCWGQTGHYLWLPNGRHPNRDDPILGWNEAGPFKALDGRLTPRETTKQSAAAIHHLNGWTGIGIHDYTVDSRGASNAAFLMDSDLSFDQAMTYATEAFPKVVTRIHAAAPITLAETCPGCPDDGRHDDRRR